MLGSGGWQDCQSLPTCPLHQQSFHLHVGRKTTMGFTPLLLILTRPLGFAIVFLMQGDNCHTPLSCSFSYAGFFLFFTHAVSWEPCSVTHDFPVKGHSHFPVVCMFSLPICGLCMSFSPAQLRTWLSSSIFRLCNIPR